MDRTAFLSVRLPPEVRNRVKAVAAARGQTVQDLVGGLVEHFLAERFCLDREGAEAVVREVVAAVAGWREHFEACGVPDATIRRVERCVGRLTESRAPAPAVPPR